MPMDANRYPADWKEISKRIRFERAGGRCEWCGAVNGEAHPETSSRVVLTVAHLDHNTQHNGEENLAALCQRCHLRHDLRLHQVNAAATRRRRRIEAGQVEMALSEAPSDKEE